MSGIWLPGAAVTISLFLVIVFFSKKNFETIEVKTYGKMILVNFLFSLNALAVYVVAKTIGIEFLIGFMQKIHLSLLLILSYYFFKYIFVINELENSRIINRIINIVLVLFILVIFIVPVEVINYEEILDVGGLSYIVSIIGVLIYFFWAIVLNIRYFLMKNKNINKNLPFIVLIILFSLGFVLRIYYPEIITETYCTTFVFLIMYHTIENPDVKMVNELTLAKQELEKANRVKSDFISSMSHEMRTPLNAIVGFSELAKYATTLEEAKENSDDIIDASNNLLNMMDKMFQVFSLESESSEIQNESYDPQSEFSKVLELYEDKIMKKGIKLEKKIDVSMPFLIGDKDIINKIVMNIIDNAYKYTNEGVITFTAKYEKEELIITVEDTGIGIKEKDLERIFTPFSKSSSTKNTSYSGMGLGLSITKSLVEKLGGNIKINSKYKNGTKVEIIINQKESTL